MGELDEFVIWLRALANRASGLAGRVVYGKLTLKDYDDLKKFHDKWYDGELDFRKKEQGENPTLSE